MSRGQGRATAVAGRAMGCLTGAGDGIACAMMREGEPEVLLLMARAPVPGRVKTRLARALGAQAACELYRCFLRDIAGRFSRGPWDFRVAVHPPGTDLGSVVGRGVPHIDQAGRNLGERMRNAFAEVFRRGAGSCVMLGADVPHVRDSDVEHAFEALIGCDVVLLPTKDGGYGLVGLREPHDLFTPVPMGTAQVLARTLDRCRRLGLTVRLLPESFDIDEVADLDRLATEMSAGRVRLPAVAAWLREHGVASR